MKEELAIQLYQQGYSLRHIASTLHIDRKRLSNILKNTGISIRMQNITSKQYTCNEMFFDDINTEAKAYWMGFLAADGFIEAKRQHGAQKIGVTLSSVDKSHLEQLRQDLQATHPISEYHGSGYNPDGSFVKLLITSQPLVDALKKHGVTEQKTYADIHIPDIPEQNIAHFIRGYYDGNGSTTIDTRRTQGIEVRLTGNACLLQELQQRLPYKTYFHIYRNVGELRIHGTNAKQFLSFIYPENTSVFLQRKYDKNMKYIER